MASIEYRSRVQVTVKNRDDLTQDFARNADTAIQGYVQELQSQGLKPRLVRLDNYYVVRTRSVAHKNLVLIAYSEVEANETKQRFESEQRPGLPICPLLRTGCSDGCRAGRADKPGLSLSGRSWRIGALGAACVADKSLECSALVLA